MVIYDFSSKYTLQVDDDSPHGNDYYITYDSSSKYSLQADNNSSTYRDDYDNDYDDLTFLNLMDMNSPLVGPPV